MIVFLAIFLVVCLYGVRVKPADGQPYMTDYMSVEKTMAIKGIFIIVVFFQHFNSYLTYTSAIDVFYSTWFNKIGQCMVTLFMLYSGYGVMESIRKKNMPYVRKMPVTRVLGTLFRFDIAILLFALMNLILSRSFTGKQFLLSLVAWDSLGNSNWYIFAILITYIVTYLAFMIFRDKGKYYPAVVAVTIGLLAYIFVLKYFNLKQLYWYDTIILYSCGMWYSLLREKIEKLINKNLVIYCVVFLLTLAGALYFMKNRGKSFVHTELCMTLFAAAVVLFTMRVSLNNAVLRWCGKNLFGLYILQRIPMVVFREIGVADFNIYVYFILCLAVTVLLAWLFDKYVGKLWSLLTSPKRKSA